MQCGGERRSIPFSPINLIEGTRTQKEGLGEKFVFSPR